MPSPRTWNRREFNITQNGYFTILKSAGWFSAVPLPGGFRYLRGETKGAAAPPAISSASSDGSAATIQLQTVDSDTSGRHLMRLALIVVAATGLAWILLWCTAFA